MPSCKSFESLRNLSEPQDFLGCLFVFEGLDGSGKTTQARLLADYLAKFLPKRPLLLKEPSLGPFGLTIREKILASQSPLDPQEEMKLFLADRAWDVEHNILPALKDNRCVIIDRYILSNVAYQGARGLKEPKLIFEANLPFPQPNLTFLLELSVRAGLGRVMDRGPLDPGFENEVFLEKVKNIYDSIDLTDLIRLSATSSILVIHRQILSIINERCPKLKTIFSGK